MSVRAMANATIISWKSRTGSDAQGQPTYGAEQVTTPIRCVATAPNFRQSQTAEREDFTVDIMVTVDRNTDIRTGDVIQCTHDDVVGKTLEVRKTSGNYKRGLAAVQLFCVEVR